MAAPLTKLIKNYIWSLPSLAGRPTGLPLLADLSHTMPSGFSWSRCNHLWAARRLMPSFIAVDDADSSFSQTKKENTFFCCSIPLVSQSASILCINTILFLVYGHFVSMYVVCIKSTWYKIFLISLKFYLSKKKSFKKKRPLALLLLHMRHIFSASKK